MSNVPQPSIDPKPMFQQDMEPNEMYKQLVINTLDKADRQHGTDDEYLRVRSVVVNYFQKGDFKHAWLDLSNYLSNKYNNLNEAKNLSDKQIFHILAEQENPVITKGDILNLLKK